MVTNSTLHSGPMPASFDYKPRFKDMRIKPPKAGEAEAEACFQAIPLARPRR